METTTILLISGALLLVIITISMYNGLIRRRNEVDNAFGGMDVQLRILSLKRHLRCLVPASRRQDIFSLL